MILFYYYAEIKRKFTNQWIWKGLCTLNCILWTGLHRSGLQTKQLPYDNSIDRIFCLYNDQNNLSYEWSPRKWQLDKVSLAHRKLSVTLLRLIYYAYVELPVRLHMHISQYQIKHLMIIVLALISVLILCFTGYQSSLSETLDQSD